MALIYSKNGDKTHTLSEYDSIFYIFEIQIKNDETIRRIKSCKEGQIINMNDEIENNINKIKFIIYDINDSNNKIVIKRRFTEIINQPIILANNNIILYLFTQDNYVLCNYKFIN